MRVVADAVAVAGDHRIVDDDDAKATRVDHWAFSVSLEIFPQREPASVTLHGDF